MELLALVPSLKRAVAPPGEFAALFPSSTDTDLRDLLSDAVAESQLDGFLRDVSIDLDVAEVTPDLSNPQQALVVLYGAARVLTVRLANLKNRTRYVAGNVEAETEQAASVLVELLRQTNARKKQILEDARSGGAGMSFAMVDLYVTKSIDFNSQDAGYFTPGRA